MKENAITLVKIEGILNEFPDFFRTLLGDLSIVVAVIDQQGIVKFESESIEKVLGYTTDENIGTNIFTRIHPDHRSVLRQKIDNFSSVNSRNRYIESMVRHKDGSWRYLEGFMQNMCLLSSVQGILLCVRDKTKFHQIRERAVFYKINDTITKLPNREFFINQLSRALNRAQGKDGIIALLSIGINHFQHIYGIYGHSFGNQVLKRIGQRLKSTFRTDDLVCRFEGSIFMVLLTDIYHSESVEPIIEKAVHAFSSPLYIKNKKIKISAGMGVCFFPQDGKNTDELIQNSQAAMNTAMTNKTTEIVLFNKKQNRETLERIQIGHELQYALSQDQIIVHYQPKVNSEKEMVGMEALVRWNSPQRGLVCPSVFIPVAEKLSLINDIDRTVFEKTCSLLRNWQERGYRLVPIAVNVSSKSINSESFVSDIKQIIYDNRIDSKWIQLEITESGFMTNRAECIRKISVIHEMGLKVALDDFGVGYSSLSRLKDYPIDIIKIDRSFIQNILTCKRSRILVDTIITLVHDLGFMIVAEGVETEEQYEYLIERDCDQFQGFYFCKPMSAECFERK